MKVKIVGVRDMPRANCFVLIVDQGDYSSDKCKTYGINPREAWCRDRSLLNTAIDCLGCEVDVALDFSRNVISISY